jgi:hypothetical protein
MQKLTLISRPMLKIGQKVVNITLTPVYERGKCNEKDRESQLLTSSAEKVEGIDVGAGIDGFVVSDNKVGAAVGLGHLQDCQL